tara:strand:+ start:770 stop:967 length:198 start_codon:yes stop_codon:yes gene_type:complete
MPYTITEDERDAIEFAINHIRDTYNDSNLWEWTVGGTEMPDSIAQGYHTADVLETLLEELSNEEN